MSHAYRKYTPAFPKPGQIKHKAEPIKIFNGGREVIDTNTTDGWKEYRQRVYDMLERQNGFCCLLGVAPMCTGILTRREATFEHEYGRGMGGGKRDDRIEVDGVWQNGAAHEECNEWKSSRKIQYNLALQYKGRQAPEEACG